jgi:hypothetical protein
MGLELQQSHCLEALQVVQIPARTGYTDQIFYDFPPPSPMSNGDKR